MLINNQGNYLNKSETEVELDILFIASPTRLEIVNTSIFLAFLSRTSEIIGKKIQYQLQ